MKPREYIYAFMFGITVVFIVMCTAYSITDRCKQCIQNVQCKKQKKAMLDIEDGYVVLENDTGLLHL